MRSKTWIGILVICALGALSIYSFTDWFTPKRIQIIAQYRPNLVGVVRRAVSPVSFVLNGTYQLTRIRVVPLQSSATAETAQPVWELDSSSNSIPLRGFVYGQRIRGMRAPGSSRATDPLAPETEYRMFVEAGRARGQVDFQTPPAAN
jgi:hypothetical protein